MQNGFNQALFATEKLPFFFSLWSKKCLVLCSNYVIPASEHPETASKPVNL
jgi:hypothetical protein